MSIVLVVLVPVAMLVLTLLSFIYCCCVHSLRSSKMKHDFSDMRSILTFRHERSDSVSNWLNHNTELLPLHLDEMVGKGRFASVHRARLGQKSENGVFQMVAVKIFPLEEFLSWKSEYEIFLDPELCHENIVHFLAAEKHMLERQLWLITAYHFQGNLRDFLSGHQLEWEELCKMGGDVVRGLAHLHSDRNAVGGVKSAIAHRDLKSDNVLVKDDRSCCICDFGLSVKLDSNMSTEELANRGQVTLHTLHYTIHTNTSHTSHTSHVTHHILHTSHTSHVTHHTHHILHTSHTSHNIQTQILHNTHIHDDVCEACDM